MKLSVLALSMLLFTAGQAAQDVAQNDDVKKELDKLQGDWAVSSFNGEPVPAEAEAYLSFTGEAYAQWFGDQVAERGTIKLDVTSTPMKIDLIITEGQDAGVTQLGVYQVTGDTMTLTLANPGATTRPTALARGALNVVLKKAG